MSRLQVAAQVTKGELQELLKIAHQLFPTHVGTELPTLQSPSVLELN